MGSVPVVGVELAECMISEPTPEMSQAEIYRKVVLIDATRLFIERLSAADGQVFDRLLEFFSRYLDRGREVLVVLPSIVTELLVPAINSENFRVVSAVCQKLTANKRTQLVGLFQNCDADPTDARRPLEALLSALENAADDDLGDPSALQPLLDVLKSICRAMLTGYRNAVPGDAGDASTVLDHKIMLEKIAAKFNRKPSTGIVKLRELIGKESWLLDYLSYAPPGRRPSLVVSDSVEALPNFQLPAVAAFLRMCPLLDAEKVSDYISGSEKEALLTAYLNTFDFSGRPIDAALRSFVKISKLPAEA
jgi:hypothetical protein